MLLADDRLALRHKEVREAMLYEYTVIHEIPSTVWARLAALQGGGSDPYLLFHDTLRSHHRVVGYFDRKSLRPVRNLPWTLCGGNVTEKLDRLREEPCPQDEVASKIWALLQLFPSEYVKPGIDRLADVSFFNDSCGRGTRIFSSCSQEASAVWRTRLGSPVFYERD